MRSLINRLAPQENQILNHYLDLIQKDSKPDDMSKSLYLTCLSISILENMGNKFPSQPEIDQIESYVRRFSRRKSLTYRAISLAA